MQNQTCISRTDFLTMSADSWLENLDHLKDINAMDPEIKKMIQSVLL